MAIFRSPQFSAIALVVAAIAGIAAANSPIGPSVSSAVHLSIGPLSLEHWITDGLLAIFFFLAALELKHELVAGELNSASKALVPTVAAVGGVIVPAGIYLLLVRDPESISGWPIPTATDIAFALGILALVGRHLPARVRALLLALAVIDDLIAILIIAFFFTTDLNPLALIAAVPVILAFGWISRYAGESRRTLVAVVLVALALVAWALVYLAGIHPTIAGVALGLLFASKHGEAVRHAIEPWSNAIILPVFAFVATLVVIPDLATTPLGIVFWAIVIALPVGKIVGITVGAMIASRLGGAENIPLRDILVVAALGGIGFTVSLLMNELAFADSPEHATEGTLGVLVASVIAVVVGGTVGAIRSRHYARSA
jgi:NhaA family Na+:H+ antiporter